MESMPMFKNFFPLSKLIVLNGLLAVAAQANAATVYVNPVSGSDNNSGTQALPFKTITKALNTKSVTEINLAFGNYSASSGEKFPWNFKAVSAPVRIVGTGMTSTVIDVGPAFDCISQIGKVNVTFESLALKHCLLTTSEVAGRNITFRNTFLDSFVGYFRSQSHVTVDSSSISGSSQFAAADGTFLDFTSTQVDGADHGLTDFVSLDNSALNADGLFVHDMVAGTVVIDITNGSTADINNSEIRDSWGTLNGSPGAPDPITIRVTGEGSNLRSTNTSITGSAGIAVYGDFGTFININGGSYTGNNIGIYADDAASYLNGDLAFARRATFNNTQANWIVNGSEAFALLDNGNFRGGKYGIQSFNNGVISVSNSAFVKISRPIQFESINGRQSQIILGKNLNFRGNATNYSSIVAKCVEPVDLIVGGNTHWIPNVQGADASGHIEPQVIKGVKKGNNYWLKSSNCKLRIF
jgi:hypothetical protein